MAEDVPSGYPAERRSEPRTPTERFYSVEINLGAALPIYLFKLREVSLKGACIVVKEDSSILRHLNVGQLLDLKYYSTDKSNPVEFLKTEIKHITKAEYGRFKGHYLVGVSILEKLNPSNPDAI
ncbi:MAG: PilZ domain-containing protein [Desulfobacterales bacterium]|nr:MAG: PilZ domain-containing protein [Desulfobacterales bacterium]